MQNITKVNEIYNMIDAHNYRSALKLCAVAEKKYPKHPLILTLKSYCYANEEMIDELDETLKIIKTCRPITDHILSMLSNVCVLAKKSMLYLFSYDI